MAATSVEDLLRADSGLTRGFVGAVIAVGAFMIWSLFIAGTTEAGGLQFTWVGVVLFVLQLGGYIWYAVAAGAAAKALGDAGWKYVVWILAAPFLARLPIPLVSMLIGVSPLAIKFLLGNQLQTALRQETLATLSRDE